ncbi:hypothetical protein PBI_DAMIEN_40 [Mycobacterium phage Damien]|uniref:hypothetical protein n=1 Tax=Mycobacterium phage Damien TaxID=1486469 RepID=UPI00045F741B|nr:hypothetical protein HL12_gp40 [Mycobacterium phage Damien]AHZ95401.1 hypothetical protein PBI_DAMIEN_40 [Mycobacterium phage Damien]
MSDLRAEESRACANSAHARRARVFRARLPRAIHATRVRPPTHARSMDRARLHAFARAYMDARALQ